MTAGHVFGNPVAGPNEPFGNPQPQANPRIAGNSVDWLPSPAHFGNQVSFLLQTVPPIAIVAPGTTGTVDVNLTNLLGTNSAELTYFGEPVGVTLSFSPNPDTTSSTVTVTVPSDVQAGKYTITIVGTVDSPNIEYVQLHLVVAAGGSTSSAIYRVQMDLTPTQILSIGNYPAFLEVIPAPGAGLYINVLSVIAQLHHANPGWVGNDSQWNLGPEALFAVVTDAEVTPSIIANGFLNQTTSMISTWTTNESEIGACLPYPSSYFVNQPFGLTAAVSVTGSGGSVRLIVYYTIESVV
jgi:hypothetical protein